MRWGWVGCLVMISVWHRISIHQMVVIIMTSKEDLITDKESFV